MSESETTRGLDSSDLSVTDRSLLARLAKPKRRRQVGRVEMSTGSKLGQFQNAGNNKSPASLFVPVRIEAPAPAKAPSHVP
jgi:hypothetical protein